MFKYPRNRKVYRILGQGVNGGNLNKYLLTARFHEGCFYK